MFCILNTISYTYSGKFNLVVITQNLLQKCLKQTIQLYFYRSKCTFFIEFYELKLEHFNH